MAVLRRFWEKYGWMLIVAALLFVWEGAYRLGSMTAGSAPSLVAKALLENVYNREFLLTAVTSYLNVIAGMFIAFLAATPLGIVNGAMKKLDLSLTPLVMLLGSLPVIVFLPLAIYWFGQGPLPLMALTATAAFFPIYFNVREGVMGIPDDLFEAMRVFGAKKMELFHKLIVPSVWPSLFTGLRLSFQYVWEVVLAIEMVVSTSGIGAYVRCQALPASCGLAIAANINNALAGVLVIGIMMLATDRILFEKFEEDIARWKG